MKNRKYIDMQAADLFQEISFPLKVFMYDYDSPSNDWHRHNGFYELVIVCSGTAKNELPGETELVAPGTIFMMPPGALHRYTTIRHFRHYNVLFSEELLNTGNLNLARQLASSPLWRFAGRQCSPFVPVSESALSKTVLMLETIRSEMSIRSPGWREAAFAEFIRVMIYLIRISKLPDSESGQYSFQIGRAIRLMEEKVSQELTLKSIAESVNMSESSFRHRFLAVTGMSPIRYLIRLRLKKALLLLTSPTSISSIALLSGFADQNYFSRQFKKQFGITPHEFQKKYAAQQLSVNELLTGLMDIDTLICR